MPTVVLDEPGADPAATRVRLQEAVDAVHAGGGGRVVLAGGAVFETGTVELRSRVELHLETGSELRASTDPADYRDAGLAGEYGGNAGGFLLRARDAEEVAITGGGRIDGRGLAFTDGWWSDEGPYIRAPKPWRPRGIGLFGCTRIRIADLSIRDAAQWTVHLVGCDDVLVQGVTIKNRLDLPNCDGIDPDHCRNVRIIGCHVEAGDDGIVLKNTKQFSDAGPCENVLIQGCTVVSTSAAIKLGTESHGVFRDVVISGCVIKRSHRGLAIQLRDPGSIEHVLMSDCIVETRLFHDRWWGRGEPLYVTTVPRHDGDPAGRIADVRCRNLVLRGENGVFVAGSPDAPIEDLRLEAVRVELAKTSKWPGGQHDRRPMHSAEHGGLSAHPTSGVFLEHVAGAVLRDVAVRWTGERPPHYRHALETESVTGLDIAGFSGEAARSGLPAIVHHP